MWSLLIAVQLLAISQARWTGSKGTVSLRICRSDTEVHLDCGCNVIHINASNYGRTDNITCSCKKSAYNPTNTNCSSNTSLSKVKGRCEGKTRCSLMASTDFFGPDPCPGIHKYLNISYTCVPPKCQHSDGYLQLGDLLFVRKQMSWVEALHHCAKNGSRLVHILDNCTQTRVQKLLAAVVPYWGCMEKVWVGLECCMINPQAPWEWSGGAAVGDYKQWNTSFPRNPCCFHCGQLVQEGQGGEYLWQAGGGCRRYLWQDACCQEKLPFICQLTSSGGSRNISYSEMTLQSPHTKEATEFETADGSKGPFCRSLFNQTALSPLDQQPLPYCV